MATTLKEKLAKFAEDGEHKEVLDIVDKILKKKDDKTAKQFKQVALIQSGEFKRALDLIENDSIQQNKQTQMFHKAYCLYRLNRCDEALSALNSLSNVTENQILINHLRGQIEYKMGRYGNAVQTYEKLEKLQKEQPDDEDHDEDEFLTNITASYTLNRDYEKALATSKKASTYELAYNAACASISLKKYDQAMEQLKDATKKCKRALADDDYTEEQINDELAAIVVQTAYVKQMTGDVESALEVYNEIMKNKPSDKVALAVAANNLVAIHAEQLQSGEDKESKIDLFDSLKKLRFATQEKVKEKLTTEQQTGIDVNFALLHLLMNRLTECRQEVEKLSKSMPNSDIPALLEAALLLKEKQPKQAINLLEKYQERNKDNERVALSLVQIRLNRGEWAEAATALQSTSLINQPSIVRLCTELYQKVGDAKSSLNVLNNAIQYWSKQNETSKDETSKARFIELLLASARLQEEQRRHKEAASTYKMLIDQDPSKKSEYFARMVNALSYFDMEEAEKYLAQLPAVPTGHLDVNELEANKTNPFGDYQKGKAATRVDSKKETKKAKKRRNKPPKNPNASDAPDRWESKKKKKVVKATGFGTQGSDRVNLNLQHEKGHKTIHKPDQMLAAAAANKRNTPKGVVQKKAKKGGKK